MLYYSCSALRLIEIVAKVSKKIMPYILLLSAKENGGVPVTLAIKKGRLLPALLVCILHVMPVLYLVSLYPRNGETQ